MQDKNVIIYKSLLIPVSGAVKVSSTLSGQLTITFFCRCSNYYIRATVTKTYRFKTPCFLLLKYVDTILTFAEAPSPLFPTQKCKNKFL